MSEKKENTGINISVKSFITAIVVIFVLMVLTYGLTFLIPGGGIPFWKWALSPILVLGADGNVFELARPPSNAAARNGCDGCKGFGVAHCCLPRAVTAHR